MHNKMLKYKLTYYMCICNIKQFYLVIYFLTSILPAINLQVKNFVYLLRDFIKISP